MWIVLGVTILCLLLTMCQSYSQYQDQIPNSNNVQHPCKINYRWPGVGHNNPLGGGDRNLFGVDFQAAGFKWTVALCNKDTDKDGRTNGEELGDPNCVWSPGKIPTRNNNITNPGVCEPYDSPSCKRKNEFLSCDLDQFQGCGAVRKPNVGVIELKFSEVRIPAKTTTYMCQGFELQQEKDYHIIANEPLIDNRNVMHHMIVYACKVDYEVITTPHECAMVSNDCFNIISGWTVGFSGQCFGPTAGYRIGPTGYTKIQIQMHYNNPFLIDNYTDASGIRLYIQPALPEVKNMATFTVGQTQLVLRPGQSRIAEVGLCPGSCSSKLLQQPIYVIGAVNHMHYLGRSMFVELYRNGTKIANISNDEIFNYDSPIMYNHNPPLEIRPGDEIKTTCIFNTLNTGHYVSFGSSTHDEMCFGFMSVYPQEAFSGFYSCSSDGPMDECAIHARQPLAGCDWWQFGETIYKAGVQKCLLSEPCTPECRDSLRPLKDDPCLTGEASTFFRRYIYEYDKGKEILGWLHSCNLLIHSSNLDVGTTSAGHTDSSNKISAFCTVLIISMFLVLP